VFLHLTKTGRVYFLDFKIYAIYLPSITNSITISVDYLSSAFMFLVVAIGLAATVYSRVYLYGDPQTPDFIVKLLWFVFSMLLLVISKNIITLYLS
jgi:NADH:ubiquinone oxidoreductase subunit 5 (subunit L)/multisubunit Na+/H+ antiporter MnhA subunit